MDPGTDGLWSIGATLILTAGSNRRIIGDQFLALSCDSKRHHPRSVALVPA